MTDGKGLAVDVVVRFRAASEIDDGFPDLHIEFPSEEVKKAVMTLVRNGATLTIEATKGAT